MSEALQTLHRYCCKDSAVTIEICQKLDKWLKPESKRHYDFNIVLLNALLYMELRGIRYDSERAKLRLVEVESNIYRLQYELDRIAGYPILPTDKLQLRMLVREHMCWKKDQSRVKADFANGIFDNCMSLLSGTSDLSQEEMGYLSTILDKSLNTKSDALKTYLYEILKLPVQKHPVSKAVTTNNEALITLRKRSTHPSLPLIIDIGELRTRAQMLRLYADPDGRIRSSYNEVGSKTGRITSSTSPTGSGYNLQTIPDENELKPPGSPLHSGMRDLLIADDGCYLAKCDLKGADGWTVGANLASLGDSTMLDDLRFGLKPASILCYASRHGPGSTAGRSRAELLEMTKEVKKSDWDYFAAKQVIWGICYLMGIRKAVQHVFNVSEGSVSVSEKDMEQFKLLVVRRYHIDLWWKAMEKRLFNQPYPPRLVSPSGHIRMFFGRRGDILGEALAHEPQSITTYATNSAVYKCWTDPANRYGNRPATESETRITEQLLDCKVPHDAYACKLRVEPLHQVHDEFLCQFRIADTAWALEAIRSWFKTSITIAGITVTIPFDGAYGTNWAMDEHSKVGVI